MPITEIKLSILWDDKTYDNPALWNWADLLDLPNPDHVAIVNHETWKV